MTMPKAGSAWIRVVHASPDAPAVDVWAKGVESPAAHQPSVRRHVRLFVARVRHVRHPSSQSPVVGRRSGRVRHGRSGDPGRREDQRDRSGPPEFIRARREIPNPPDRREGDDGPRQDQHSDRPCRRGCAVGERRRRRSTRARQSPALERRERSSSIQSFAVDRDQRERRTRHVVHDARASRRRSARDRHGLARAAALGAGRVLASRRRGQRDDRFRQTGSNPLRAARVSGCTRRGCVRRHRRAHRQPLLHEAEQAHSSGARRVHGRLLRSRRRQRPPDGSARVDAIDRLAPARRALPSRSQPAFSAHNPAFA